MNRELKFYGDIGGKIKAHEFCDTLMKMEDSGCKQLNIRLHSYGGSVFEGNVIYNAIQQSGMNIKITVDGIAASMASVILLASNDVEIAENGYVMIHRPHSFVDGDYDGFIGSAKMLKDMEKEMACCYAKKTGRSEDEFINTWLDGKDHWLNADEAVKYGFADRKISSVSKDLKTLDKSLVSAMEIKSIFNRYAASLNIKNEKNMKKELIEFLKLDKVTEESSDEEVLERVKERFDELSQQLERENESTEETITAMINKAQADGKFLSIKGIGIDEAKAAYENIGRKSGIKTLSMVLEGLPRPVNIVEMIKKESRTASLWGDMNQTSNQKTVDKSKWTLEDYRMYAPNELKNNPQLYDKLYKNELTNNQ